MFIDLTDDQRALQAELRRYFGSLVSPEEAAIMRTERHGPTYREVVRRMGKDGWLGVGWPVEFGGRGFGDVEQQIFANEAVRADVPLPSVTLQTVGPTLQVYGTDEQKRKFLPAILAGEVHFAIGYSEPEAGTDLAALRTTAVRDGDHYIVNGQKIFTTGGHDADYIWLAVRTGPAESRHRGISVLIVDTKDPGFSWTPIITCDGAHHVNATYYSDVRVPVEMLVGEENKVEAHHHPAQPRTRHARPGRSRRRHLRPARRVGPRPRTPGPSRGATRTRRDPRDLATQRTAQLAGRGEQQRRVDIADARRPRCSPPSGSSASVA